MALINWATRVLQFTAQWFTKPFS